MRPLLLVLLLAACDAQLEVSKPADTARVSTDTTRHHGKAKGHEKHHKHEHGEHDR